VVVFARTSKAASRLSEQFRQTEVEKQYWALVEGRPDPPGTACVDWLRKDEHAQRMVIARTHECDAQEARLAYRTLARLPRATLLEVRLETGRKHQIRVQLAARGHPILGDRKYGATTAFPAGIALHARRLSLQHPVRHVPQTFEAPLPACWRRYGVEDQ
jgi:23S rRNA pseudouridine1911/1915/1917 synthase